MPDPRGIAYEGIDAEYNTHQADGVTITYDITKQGGSAAINKAVGFSASKTVELVADGESIEGRLVLVEPDGACTVQTGGYTNLPAGNGAAVTPGGFAVGALGPAGARGYIRNRVPTVAAEMNTSPVEIVDTSDPTHVVIDMA